MQVVSGVMTSLHRTRTTSESLTLHCNLNGVTRSNGGQVAQCYVFTFTQLSILRCVHKRVMYVVLSLAKANTTASQNLGILKDSASRHVP